MSLKSKINKLMREKGDCLENLTVSLEEAWSRSANHETLMFDQANSVRLAAQVIRLLDKELKVKKKKV
jgi:hypothetical protein